ncbi:MAG: glutamate-5-semialdehyde dehydrogenase [Gammaproteobacteria bacterium]
MNKTDIKKYIKGICVASQRAAMAARSLSSIQRVMIIKKVIKNLKNNNLTIIKKNSIDIKLAKQNNLSDALIDRLLINSSRIKTMINGLEEINTIPDTLYKKINKSRQSSGITVEQMRVPLGVIAMIYESRPNVTIDAAGLSLKSGNSIILRGGSEAINSNLILSSLIKKALLESKVSADMVQIVKTIDRVAVSELLKMDSFIDVIIPRGGKGLIKKVSEESKIPVIKHLDGNCHVYIDKDADFKTAMSCTINSKTQRYGVCNAAESLLIHKSFPKSYIKEILHILEGHKVEIRGCSQTKKLHPKIKSAKESDWYEEYLKPIISVKIVPSIDDAISHIEKYGSKHTEAIISKNKNTQDKFLREVDSSSVMVNTSTRFADGYEYGLGAEIGISTDKIHARGPVGLEGLTNLKYIVNSRGVIRN